MFGVYVVDDEVCELYEVGGFEHAAGYAQLIAESGDKVLVRRVSPEVRAVHDVQFQAWVDRLFGSVARD